MIAVCECGARPSVERPGRYTCPRCGRAFRVARKDFERVAQMSGLARSPTKQPGPAGRMPLAITGTIPWDHLDAAMREALGEAERTIPYNSRVKVGPGDLVARFTSAFGIKPCRSCRRRRDSLNQLGWRIVAGTLTVTMLTGIVLGVVGTLAVAVW